uniref:Uncharacterized protein n=1 Tax=Anguilla anguilla TaxID=7936 RepID=A0A0E9PN62_ANGAN
MSGVPETGVYQGDWLHSHEGGGGGQLTAADGWAAGQTLCQRQ